MLLESDPNIQMLTNHLIVRSSGSLVKLVCSVMVPAKLGGLAILNNFWY